MVLKLRVEFASHQINPNVGNFAVYDDKDGAKYPQNYVCNLPRERVCTPSRGKRSVK
jgi:hypothetical protein